MKIFRVILFCCIAALLISCAHFSKPVDSSFKSASNTAIIYGRFELGTEFNAGNELALWLADKNSKAKYIQFKSINPVYCIPVGPGRYKIIGFIGTDRTHRIWGRKKFPKALSFDAPTNSATYIGDFTGTASYDFAGMMQQWSVKSVADNFTETTEEFRGKFPNLASLPATSAFVQDRR
ncbi:MAG: hypothetical protein ACREFE_03710 [Limisphaerales bacterium]